LIKITIGRFKRFFFFLKRNKNHSFAISEERERRIIVSGISNLFAREIVRSMILRGSPHEIA